MQEPSLHAIIEAVSESGTAQRMDEGMPQGPTLITLLNEAGKPALKEIHANSLPETAQSASCLFRKDIEKDKLKDEIYRLSVEFDEDLEFPLQLETQGGDYGGPLDLPLDILELPQYSDVHYDISLPTYKECIYGAHSGGKVEFKETLVEGAGTAKNSTMLTRAPAEKGSFTRGKSTNFPFHPGGVGRSSVGTKIHKDKHPGSNNVEDISLSSALRALGFRGKTEIEAETEPPVELKVIGSVAEATSITDEDARSKLEKDEVERLRLEESKDDQESYAVRRRIDVSNYEELVPHPAVTFPFELDPFQKEAVIHLERGENVFVSAHTSAGKTVIADYAIALCFKHRTRCIYTSPIKALSNQKFHDFKRNFEDVGIITGDVSINKTAACLIVTTEILRSMLYKGADIIRDVEWVVFDEVHYVNDFERGVVWEEAIIMLPDHVNMIMLSATVPNAFEFADWIGRTKRKKVHVIQTFRRPTPLEHYAIRNQEMKLIVTMEKKFLAKNFLELNRNDRFVRKNLHKKYTLNYHRLLKNLKQSKLLPGVVFAFSKKKCELLAGSLSSLDLTDPSEKSRIHTIIHTSLKLLSEENRKLQQVQRSIFLLERGIGVHHGGLIPILKEITEMLFAKGHIKILFATETFALGINMPARTVVFDSIRKNDGRTFRTILPSEYIQMSGRAGRRGIDTVGTVILNLEEMRMPGIHEMRALMNGLPTPLTSKFRLTYVMLLNLVRVPTINVVEILRRSFSEFEINEEELRSLDEVERDIEDLEPIECREIDLAAVREDEREVQVNPFPIEEYVNAFSLWRRATARLGSLYLEKSKEFRKKFVHGRVLVTPEGRLSVVVGAEKLTSVEGNVRILEYIEDTTPPEVSERILPVMEAFDITKHEIELPYRYTGKDEFMESQVASQLELLRKKTRNVLERFKPADLNLKPTVEMFGLVEELEVLMGVLDSILCRTCEWRQRHMRYGADINRLRAEKDRFIFQHSAESLAKLPEYNKRIAVLKKLGYLDSNGTVTIKGKLACEVRAVEDLFLAEFIFRNGMEGMGPSEVAAIMSSMLNDRSASVSKKLWPKKVLEATENLLVIAQNLADVQIECGVEIDTDEYVSTLHFSLVHQTWLWAEGHPFSEIMESTSLDEGTVLRCFIRLHEMLRDVGFACKVVGEEDLSKVCYEASERIRRDIVIAPSLYLT